MESSVPSKNPALIVWWKRSKATFWAAVGTLVAGTARCAPFGLSSALRTKGLGKANAVRNSTCWKAQSGKECATRPWHHGKETMCPAEDRKRTTQVASLLVKMSSWSGQKLELQNMPRVGPRVAKKFPKNFCWTMTYQLKMGFVCTYGPIRVGPWKVHYCRWRIAGKEMMIVQIR